MRLLIRELLHTLSSGFVAYVAAGFSVIVALYLVDGRLAGRARAAVRYAGAGLLLLLFLSAVGRLEERQHRVHAVKAMLALAAAGCVLHERSRAAARRPIAERWKRFAGGTLGLAAVVAHFQGFDFESPRFYNRWDQYHYYMGARYFPELGYDGLYRCTAVAQDELGFVTAPPPDPAFVEEPRVDFTKEVHHEDKKIRNLGGDNLLMPVADVLAHPEACKAAFSPERWAAYKDDVRFFRMACDRKFWQDMQTDHGYNPPPVWTLGGSFFAGRYPAGEVFELPLLGKVVWLQLLAMLDLVYLAATFAALWWAFGWRVTAVAAIFWGCQAAAPFSWTGGGFLRQDWLFWLVLSVCLARRRWFFWAGAAVAYSALLRVFPGLTLIGWLVVAGAYLVRRRRPAPEHLRMLAGGVSAGVLLVALSVRVVGPGAYRGFYEHTLKVHDRTPLTNHMGLRVLVSQAVPFEIAALGIGTGKESGRMKYTRDFEGLVDPFEVWKRMRNDRYDRLRWVGWSVAAALLGAFVWVVRRVRSAWIAQCLAQVFIVLMSQLTCYYYSFMILLAPLTRVERELELPLFGVAVLSHGIVLFFFWNDDKYWVLTAASLLLCLGVLWPFVTPEGRARIRGLFARRGPDRPLQAG